MEYHFDATNDPRELFDCLLGLAHVAAMDRSRTLGDEMLSVIRSYRQLFRDELGPLHAFRIGLVAAASRADLKDWCKYVGVLVSALSFGDLEANEAESLHNMMYGLCDVVPELWATCSSGIAALEARALS